MKITDFGRASALVRDRDYLEQKLTTARNLGAALNVTDENGYLLAHFASPSSVDGISDITAERRSYVRAFVCAELIDDLALNAQELAKLGVEL